MPIKILGNCSNDSENGIDKSPLVQKSSLRTNYIETTIEEDIDLKNQYRIKKITDPISIRKTASKSYVDDNFNDPSTIENTAHVDFIEKNSIIFV